MQRESGMAKGQKRSNREIKKPKATKAVAAAPTSSTLLSKVPASPGAKKKG